MMMMVMMMMMTTTTTMMMIFIDFDSNFDGCLKTRSVGLSSSAPKV
jgi:hypothetical protein